MDPVCPQYLGRISPKPSMRNKTHASRKAAQEDIVRDRLMRHHFDGLWHQSHTETDRISRGPRGRVGLTDTDPATVWHVNAREDFHECALASAICSDETDDLAGAQCKRDPL
jgi:hypothetical protein